MSPPTDRDTIDSKVKSDQTSSQQSRIAQLDGVTTGMVVAVLILISSLGMALLGVSNGAIDIAQQPDAETASEVNSGALPAFPVNVTHTIVDIDYRNNSLQLRSKYSIDGISRGQIEFSDPPESSVDIHHVSGGAISGGSGDTTRLAVAGGSRDNISINYTISQDETYSDQVQTVSYSYVYHALPVVNGTITVNESRYRLTQSSLTAQYASAESLGTDQSDGSALFTDPAITGSAHAVTITGSGEAIVRTWSGPASKITLHDHSGTIETNEEVAQRVEQIVHNYNQFAQAVTDESSVVTVNIVDNLATDISGAAFSRPGGETSIIMQRASLITQDTLAHELVHALQRTNVATDMEWWYEASAEYYSIALSSADKKDLSVSEHPVYNAGWGSRAAAHVDSANLTEPNRQMSLSDPSSWEKPINYYRGARVLKHIEHELNKQGTISMRDVFAWMNNQSGKIDYRMFRSYLSEHTTDEFIDRLDSYVTETEPVPLP